MHYQNSPISDPSLNDKNAKELSEKNLCVLCFLFVHPFVFIRGGYRGKEIFVPLKGKNHKPQRSGRTQRGRNIHKMLFWFFRRKPSALSACSVVAILPSSSKY
jgi:hypothetical protein